ncbi:hypothetical protein AB4279_21815, partial [Vibrio cyclitrophicus]
NYATKPPNFITSSLVAEWLKTDTNIRKKKIINLCADPTSLSLPINARLSGEQRNTKAAAYHLKH